MLWTLIRDDIKSWSEGIIWGGDDTWVRFEFKCLQPVRLSIYCLSDTESWSLDSRSELVWMSVMLPQWTPDRISHRQPVLDAEIKERKKFGRRNVIQGYRRLRGRSFLPNPPRSYKSCGIRSRNHTRRGNRKENMMTKWGTGMPSRRNHICYGGVVVWAVLMLDDRN